MLDLKFDIEKRELVWDNVANDLTTTQNPSIQNGGILMYSRCANILNPMSGIGMEEVIGANMTKVAYEMNRWKKMVKDDGATAANWTASVVGGNQAKIEMEVTYL